jgi:hypothetical protein
MANFRDPKPRAEIPTSVRLPADMKARLESAARMEGRSISAEIVTRLATSLEMIPPPIEAGEVPTSRTAREALTLAKATADSLRKLEEALFFAIFQNEDFLRALSDEAQTRFRAVSREDD